MIAVDIPGRGSMRLTHAVFDFNGTLALDGVLLPQVDAWMERLRPLVDCRIFSADTHGTAADAARRLKCPLVSAPTLEDKARLVEQLGDGVAAVGNGRNDADMLRLAALGIAVIGPEGASASTLAAADIVVTDIGHAFGLLLHPMRLVATLRT